jgi:hypothetical protein
MEPEFKGGFAREFHLCQEMQMTGLLHFKDSEEIYGVPCIEPGRIPATPAQADASHDAVHGASE